MPTRSRPSLAAVGLLLALAGCATTEQTRSVEASGFLKDYSQLKPGRGDQALLVYINPQADFSQYQKVIVDPVTIWYAEGSDLADVPREELQRLADYLETAMRKQLQLDFQLVERPEPGTLRIRTAITEARKSKVVLDLVSTVLPPARLLSQVGKLATGTHAFAGRAAIEGELLDAVSNQRLVAVVDERAGGKALRGSTSAWADVQQAFDYWADVLRARLSAFRQFDAAQAGLEEVLEK
jgi:hypothetical protein